MFGRKSKPNPTIRADWFELEFDQKDRRWTLTYRDIDFSFPGPDLTLPERTQLDAYIGWVEANRAHIDSNIQEMVASWTDVYINASKAHIAMIEVEHPDRIVVMILGDETWGDIGYDLWIENGVIVNEGFSD